MAATQSRTTNIGRKYSGGFLAADDIKAKNSYSSKRFGSVAQRRAAEQPTIRVKSDMRFAKSVAGARSTS
jgi:hypothetical protein